MNMRFRFVLMIYGLFMSVRTSDTTCNDDQTMDLLQENEIMSLLGDLSMY